MSVADASSCIRVKLNAAEVAREIAGHGLDTVADTISDCITEEQIAGYVDTVLAKLYERELNVESILELS